MKLIVTPFACALLLAFGVITETPFSLCHNNSFMPAAIAQEAKKEMPACLAEIAKATVIEDSSMRSAKLKDSLLAAQKLGGASKDSLVEIIQTGTPAGRILSLALLKKIDAGQYQKLADSLKQEQGDQSVSYISPTERCHYSVSDILSDMASKEPLIKLLPVPASK